MLDIIHFTNLLMFVVLGVLQLMYALKKKQLRHMLFALMILMEILMNITMYMLYTANDINGFKVFMIVSVIVRGVIYLLAIWFVSDFSDKKIHGLVFTYIVFLILNTTIAVLYYVRELIQQTHISAFKSTVMGKADIWAVVPMNFQIVNILGFIQGLVLYFYLLLITNEMSKKNHKYALKFFAVSTIYYILTVSDIFYNFGIVPVKISIYLLIIPYVLLYKLIQKPIEQLS